MKGIIQELGRFAKRKRNSAEVGVLIMRLNIFIRNIKVHNNNCNLNYNTNKIKSNQLHKWKTRLRGKNHLVGKKLN